MAMTLKAALALQPEERIRHLTFGLGTVKHVTTSQGATVHEARINFDKHGEKILVLAFAHPKLSRVTATALTDAPADQKKAHAAPKASPR